MTDTIGSGAVELDQEFLPLRLLGHLAAAVLASLIVLAAARLVAPGFTRGDLPIQAAAEIGPVMVLSRIALVATIILFLIWFRRARINAERATWRQRRARAWVFWGWVIPFGSLWIPFQLMGDIWRAGLPPVKRTRTAWLPVSWWISWLLLTAHPAVTEADSQPGTRTGHGSLFPPNWPSFALFAVAGLILIAIIEIVSHGPIGEP